MINLEVINGQLLFIPLFVNFSLLIAIVIVFSKTTLVSFFFSCCCLALILQKNRMVEVVHILSILLRRILAWGGAG